MLDLIVKSKIRQGLLLLFIYNPAREYYINEAAKIIGTSAGNAQREMEKLASLGLLTKEKKANRSFFRANAKGPLFGDVKNLITKTIGIEHQLKKELNEKRGIKYAFLFGSYAKGSMKADSDIDLYVIGDNREEDLYEAVGRVEKNIKRDINYHLAREEEFKLNLKKSFFHREITGNYLLLIGDKNEFAKLLKSAGKRRKN